jgi:hypothetical protein
MAPVERLRQLPGYFAFNTGVMFFIGLASKLTGLPEGAGLGAEQLRLMGVAVLLGLLALAAGFASAARIEFARRAGKPFAIAWIAPAVLIGLPLGRAAAAGAFDKFSYIAAAIGMAAALAGLAWLSLRARQEVKA